MSDSHKHNEKQKAFVNKLAEKNFLQKLWQAFFRSAKDEGRFLLKHRWDFSMMFWLPLVTIFLIWWVFSQTVITNLPIGVVDYSHGRFSNTLIQYLDASPELEVKQLYTSEKTAEQAILATQIYAIVVIGSDFDNNIFAGKPAPITLQVNAQYGTHSGIIQKGVRSVVSTISAGVEIQRLVKQGTGVEQAKVLYSPITINRVSLFNTGANYQQFLASTVIPALLHILAMVIGATTVGRELRDKRLGDWYTYISGLTLHRQPLFDRRIDALIHQSIYKQEPQQIFPTYANLWLLIAGLNGKFIWSMLSYTLWGAIALTLASSVHQASFPALLITYFAFLLLMMVSFWLGAIFTLASYSLRMGLSATGFISAPSYAFAGVTFPYIAMSSNAQHWADILPLTHYLKLHIAQLQMNAPIFISLPIIYGFIVAVLVCLLLSALLTKRDLKHPERWGAR